MERIDEYLRINKCLHVKESLEAGVEALIGDLLPEGFELRLVN